jgi:hypothetical protein
LDPKATGVLLKSPGPTNIAQGQLKPNIIELTLTEGENSSAKVPIK